MSSISPEALSDLQRRIRSIPHLDLGLRFDVPTLLKEYAELPKSVIRPYESKTQHSYVHDLLARSWHGAALVSPSGETWDGLSEMPTDAGANLRVTPLTYMVPYMTKIVRAFGTGLPGIARLMLVKPGGHLTWHSHWYDYPRKDRGRVVVHVPVVMPEKFRYSVMDIEKYRFSDFTEEMPTIYNRNYPPGQAWLFNSYHAHNVFNHDKVDRVSLMLYLDLTHPTFAEIVDQAERKYNDVRIQ